MAKVNKDHIINVAAQLVREKGFNGVSMSDIAKAVGLQKASLYSHFASKEELVALALEHVLGQLLTGSRLTGNALQDFSTLVGDIAELLKETRRCIGFHLLYGLDLAVTDVPVTRFFESLETQLMTSLMQAPDMSETLVRQMVRDVISQLEGASIWLLLDSDVGALERAVASAGEQARRLLENAGPDVAHLDEQAAGRIRGLEKEKQRLQQDLATLEAEMARLESIVEADSCFRNSE